MKRRKLTGAKIGKAKTSDPGSLSNELIERSAPTSDESPQVHPGVVVVDGCEVAVFNNAGEEGSGSLPPRVAELTLNETDDKPLDTDFNDRFPDEILLLIFKYLWRPVHCWEAAKVCKRWFVLLARNELQKRSNHPCGRYPCTRGKKKDLSGKEPRCKGSSQALKLTKIHSEWKLSKDLLNSCRRHTHSLEIKDCTHVSVRGYQLIAAFASNLKSIRLEKCNSMDDPSMELILGRCSSLRSMHLSIVPKLTLKYIDHKAVLLQELQVYGCPNVTAATVFSMLIGCPRLKTLCLSAMGVTHDWNPSLNLDGNTFRLQNLKLSNSLAVTDAFLRAFTDRLPNLRTISLTNCRLLSDVGIQHMISVCGRGLHRLVVSQCPAVSDDSVRAIASMGSNLRDLSLAGTNVGDAGIEALISSDAVVRNMRTISLACCGRVTEGGLLQFASRPNHLGKLKTLDVQNCPGLSIFGLTTLLNSAEALKIVSEKSSVIISE